MIILKAMSYSFFFLFSSYITNLVNNSCENKIKYSLAVQYCSWHLTFVHSFQNSTDTRSLRGQLNCYCHIFFYNSLMLYINYNLQLSKNWRRNSDSCLPWNHHTEFSEMQSKLCVDAFIAAWNSSLLYFNYKWSICYSLFVYSFA